MTIDCTSFNCKQREHDEIERKLREFLADPKNKIEVHAQGESALFGISGDLARHNQRRLQKLTRTTDPEES